MKVTFLGTGTSQGIPIIGSDHPVCKSDNLKDRRLRSSVLINWDNYNFVIDCGPDFRTQMLNSNCSKIDAIIYTHEHSDHVAGLDDIRPFFFKQGKIPIYAHKRVLNELKKRFYYVFDENYSYPGSPKVIENIISSNFNINNKEIIPIDALHRDLQIFGYRFEKFAYLTDVKTIEDKEINKLNNLDVLVVNALRIEHHYSHFNLEQALEFIKIVKPKKAYLTHISHMLGFHDEVQKILPENVFLAYDGLEITI
jgi:phosphoribosyl 1,2-cyclic phosphate phosphodiesterase